MAAIARQMSDMQQALQDLQSGSMGYRGSKGGGKGGKGRPQSTPAGNYPGKGNAGYGAGGKNSGGKGDWNHGRDNGWHNGGDYDNAGAKDAGMPDKAQWPCRRMQCSRPDGKLNFGIRTTCNWCGCDKGAAMSPPKEERKDYVVPVDGAPGKDAAANGAAPAGGAAPAKPAAVNGAKPGGGAAPAAAADNGINPPHQQLAPDELSMLKNLGVTAVRATNPAKGAPIFLKPELKQQRSADDEVAAACKSSDRLAEAQAAVDYCKTSLLNVERELARTDLADGTVKGHQFQKGMLETRQKEQEKIVADLSGKAGGDAALHELNEKRSEAEKKEARRSQRATTKGEEAQSRFERLRSVLQSQKDRLDEKILELETDFAESSSAFLIINTEQAKRHMQRLAAWDKRIGSAEGAGNGMAVTPPSPDNAACPAMDANQRLLEAQQALVLAQQAAEKARADLAAQPVSLPANCGIRIRYVASDLQEMGVLSTTDAACLATIYANATAWERQGLVPIQFSTLLTGCTDLPSAMKGLTAVVGQTIWEKFFNQDEVSVDHYVPMQFGTVLYAIFTKLDKKTASAATKLAPIADATFATVADKDEIDKKQRGGVYTLW